MMPGIVLVAVLVAAASIPAASAYDKWGYISDYTWDYNGHAISASFDLPSEYDGWASEMGCEIMARGFDLEVPGYEDFVHFLASQGKGLTAVVHGEQTPQAYHVCSYGDITYFVGDYHDHINYRSRGWAFNPFTGITTYGFSHESVNPYSSNPFEPIGTSLIEYLPMTTILRTDMGDYNLYSNLYGALVAYPFYMPLDDKITFRVEGILQPQVTVELMLPELFGFDEKKYDGGVLVNGDPIPVESYSNSEITITVNMAEYGWPQLEPEETRNKAEKLYRQMYGQYYMDKYGEIPVPDYDHYVEEKLREPSSSWRKDFSFLWYERYLGYIPHLITYHGAVLDVEIPLVVHDKESHYTGSHPDIGWCRDPLVLVARSHSETPQAACVTPQTADKLKERRWTHEVPSIPEQTREKFEDKMARRGLQYSPGNADPHEAFRAALLGMPHTDDVRVLETIPGVSYRDSDYILFKGGDWRDVNAGFEDLAKIGLECDQPGPDYIWNSPEPKDERIIEPKCKRR